MRPLFVGGIAIASLVPLTALAADLGAAAPASVPGWSGFYLSAGGGAGWWSADQHTDFGGNPSEPSAHTTGSGGFGTLGGGFDWQFAPSWVAGAFADVQFGDIRGTIRAPFEEYSGTTNNRLNYAAGLRLGVLAAPNALIYINGGYTHADFSGSGLDPTPLVPLSVAEHHHDGWFVGGGIENSLDFTGVASPGWFMKTEYRFADYGRETAQMYIAATGAPDNAISFKPTVQTLSVSLVYRFNADRAGGVELH
ncbi:outer membrane beta-barrel protein [Mesorhizobium sp. WSM4884]|uniref:outer membrane protein n=1 Tax=Mesorhizobium sp. WSM4884 TaxID=3038542 RepID=UPI00241671AD|nr:outer membrane beta-barrel protein [Mesorhizobium sp. WSM4884]MDG4882522.1 autotransporter domain-containing protein [Mesorhizobium sp. WSM4884]